MTYFSATEKLFRTSQLGNKGFSSLKMESKNEFFVSVAGMKF